MAKILLVEDDNNLREIFEMRLQADGYQTVTASDGEEALTVAMREKPDLIIADVMMPKLSGFEMLETLRAAPDMANTKVIMMTALGQAEDRARGEKLGVIKYLVKSQVTLEDFVRVVREVLQPDQAGAVDQAAPKTDSAAKPLSSTNKESEQSMQDDTQPTNQPGGDMGTSGGDMGGQMSTEEEKKEVDEQASSATPGAPGMPGTGGDSSTGGGMGSPAPGGDEPPASPPPSGTPGETNEPPAPGTTPSNP